MKSDIRQVVGRYSGFLLCFLIAVAALWFFGGALFAVLLERSRAFTPPPFLTWLSLISSLCAALAFCALPFSLLRIVRGRSDLPFGWVVLCIGGFLFLCGLTALLGLVSIWFHGAVIIWALVLTRMGCALLAVATLFILHALVPHILKIPTQAQLLALQKDLLRAEAQSEERDKLLAVVSHELRTPLAPLLAALGELEQRLAPNTDAETRACLQLLRKNIQREARLVTDLVERLEIPTAEPVTPSGTANSYTRPWRLLLVEDHADTLHTFARILRRKGYEVQEAANVSEALAVARPGDLLLSDIALPDGNGCDLMRRLSSLGIQGIAISGYGTSRDREQYRRAGFIESLIKPVDVDQVVGAIGRVMAGSM